MTLAMTLGMTIGVKRSMHMMWGELLGVALVAILAVIGVATIMLKYPSAFATLKYLGGGYLIYLGIQMWRSKGKLAISDSAGSKTNMKPLQLASQGFITAIANPKGWVFMISLLPPFINPEQALSPQLSVLVAIIIITEFSCLLMYASGGQTLRLFLQKSNNVRLLNKIAGSLMIFVGFWLALG
ncbi:LysE family translocator [Moritella sp. 24]|uniref:LysE family translocator n=1 Tax=Moritella sp. 24 TaxID=2746230 RepID=UPI0021060D22|nr:LysE family translocator [Moritella sp. 24]